MDREEKRSRFPFVDPSDILTHFRVVVSLPPTLDAIFMRSLEIIYKQTRGTNVKLYFNNFVEVDRSQIMVANQRDEERGNDDRSVANKVGIGVDCRTMHPTKQFP